MPAVPKLYDHGWFCEHEFKYVTVLERAGTKLYDFAVGGSNNHRADGCVQLIAARVIDSVLETIEYVWSRYGQVLCSLVVKDLYVRADWQSGFMKCLDFQNPAKFEATTASFPFFTGDKSSKVTMTDAYFAVLLCFASLVEVQTYNYQITANNQKAGE
jgi:hypothetical protein